jgi:hypothetical protein
MSAQGQKPTLIGYSITSSALPRSRATKFGRGRQIVRCVPPAKRRQSQRFVATKCQRIEIARK